MADFISSFDIDNVLSPDDIFTKSKSDGTLTHIYGSGFYQSLSTASQIQSGVNLGNGSTVYNYGSGNNLYFNSLVGQNGIIVANSPSTSTVNIAIGSYNAATGGGNDKVIYENDKSITTNYTISQGKNGMSAGPITINNGVTLTVPNGSVYTVV